MEGVIIKGIGGFYYVQAEDQHCYECKARGKFRLDEMTPLAGDRVLFDADEAQKKGYLLEILPRKNELKRPPVANVDQFVLVLAASSPKPDMLLCDKLLIQASCVKVDAIIVLNKCDEADDVIFEQVREDYAGLDYPFLYVSAKTGEGIDALSKQLLNRLSCFSGQSAVGKSSILNRLCSSFELETGGLSRKTARGKHTTRASTLMKLDYGEGYVLDTPGFSLLDIQDLPPEELALYYPEMQDYLGKCRFGSCQHVAEPDCAVKAAVAEGKISKGRYERYEQLMQEQTEKEKRKYK